MQLREEKVCKRERLGNIVKGVIGISWGEVKKRIVSMRRKRAKGK